MEIEKPTCPRQWKELEKKIREELRLTDNEELRKHVSENLKLECAHLHVLFDGLRVFFGLCVLSNGEELWVRCKGGLTIRKENLDVVCSACFEDFWLAISPSQRTLLQRLDNICILDRHGNVIETTLSADIQVDFKEYQRKEMLLDSDIIRLLLQKVLALEEKVEKVYNAPHMPGYVEAKQRFQEKQTDEQM